MEIWLAAVFSPPADVSHDKLDVMRLVCSNCAAQINLCPEPSYTLRRLLWQGVSVVVKTHTADNLVVADITLSTEVGMMGAPELSCYEQLL